MTDSWYKPQKIVILYYLKICTSRRAMSHTHSTTDKPSTTFLNFHLQCSLLLLKQIRPVPVNLVLCLHCPGFTVSWFTSPLSNLFYLSYTSLQLLNLRHLPLLCNPVYSYARYTFHSVTIPASLDFHTSQHPQPLDSINMICTGTTKHLHCPSNVPFNVLSKICIHFLSPVHLELLDFPFQLNLLRCNIRLVKILWAFFIGASSLRSLAHSIK